MAALLPSSNPCCTGCTSQSVDVITPDTAAGFFNPDTIPLLRTLPNLSTNVFAHVNGDQTFNDGGGGDYSWRSAATNSDDGLAWIKPNDTLNTDPGRWAKVG